GELAVDLDGAPQLGVLGVDDPLQDRVHDLQVGDIRGDADQRDVELVRLPDHVRRDLRQVAFRLDHEPRRADRGQVAHEVLLGRLVVLDGDYSPPELGGSTRAAAVTASRVVPREGILSSLQQRMSFDQASCNEEEVPMASYTIEIPDGLHHEIQERRHQIDVADVCTQA